MLQTQARSRRGQSVSTAQQLQRAVQRLVQQHTGVSTTMLLCVMHVWLVNTFGWSTLGQHFGQRLVNTWSTFWSTCHTGAPLPDALAGEVPTAWERLGDLALIPTAAFASPEWQRLVPAGALWPAVAAALGVSRLARQVGV